MNYPPLLRQLGRLVQPILEDATLFVHASASAGDVMLCMVYRTQNARLVQEIVREPVAAGWQIRLWGLDGVDPDLAPLTCGSGAGPKFTLLNKLLALDWPKSHVTIVFSDDDFTVSRGNLVRFVRIMRLTRLDIAQPVHATVRSAYHPVTLRRGDSLARLTGFVEIGPVFAFSPAACAHALPFPDDAGMGWGLEFEWVMLARDGLRLGAVDAVSLDHLVPAGTHYDPAAAWWEMVHRLERAGLSVPDWRGDTLARWPAYCIVAPRRWRSASPLPAEIGEQLPRTRSDTT